MDIKAADQFRQIARGHGAAETAQAGEITAEACLGMAKRYCTTVGNIDTARPQDAWGAAGRQGGKIGINNRVLDVRQQGARGSGRPRLGPREQETVARSAGSASARRASASFDCAVRRSSRYWLAPAMACTGFIAIHWIG